MVTDPPNAVHETPAATRPAPARAPVTPLAKPVSRGVAAALALALAGAVGLAWLDARNSAQALRSDVTRRLADEDAAIAQAKARDSDQTGELREAGAKLALLETRLSELQAQQASLEAQYQDIAPSRDEIVLTEVEQMLLLASQQLSLAANVPAALAALQLADSRLAGTNRTALDAAAACTGQGYGPFESRARCRRSGHRGEARPGACRHRHAAACAGRAPARTGAVLGATRGIRVAGFFRSVWNDLRSVVRIEVSDRVAAPLVPPAQAYYLRENLRLRLLAARVALLTRDESSFKVDIAAANTWVKTYFDTRAKSVQALSATLAQLGLTAMPAELPDVNESLTSLRTLKASRERTGIRAASTATAPLRAP